MIHDPVCPCGGETYPGDIRAHRWVVGTAVLLRFPGESLAPLHSLNFGEQARWKYMGERRRWRKLIRPALPDEWAIMDPAVFDCPACRNTRWRERRNRKGHPVKKLCRTCGSKRHVVVYRIRGPRQRQWDAANLVAACRPIMDSLVEHGYLVDDGPQWMEALYSDEHKRDQAEVAILITREAVT